MTVDVLLWERGVWLIGRNRILRPGFFMENFNGFIGSITTAVLKAGLDADTTNGLIVSCIFLCRSSIVRLTPLSRRTI